MLFKLSMAAGIAGYPDKHMSLRFKFLFGGLFVLIIPWINYLYIQQMEGILRGGLEHSALAEVTRIAQELANPEFALAGLPTETQVPEDSESDRQTIYAHPLSSTPEIDGRREGCSKERRYGWDINLDPFRPMVEISKHAGVKRFFYASSSSVYGIKDESNVHEDMSLEPLTDYSVFKMKCEEILSEYQITIPEIGTVRACLLYTSDAADE